MMKGMFKFRSLNGIAWVNLSSVDAFVATGRPQMPQGDNELRHFSILFNNGKVTEILSTEQELDQVIIQFWVRADK